MTREQENELYEAAACRAAARAAERMRSRLSLSGCFQMDLTDAYFELAKLKAEMAEGLDKLAELTEKLKQ